MLSSRHGAVGAGDGSEKRQGGRGEWVGGGFRLVRLRGILHRKGAPITLAAPV